MSKTPTLINWSPLGCSYEKLGKRGCINLGITISVIVGEVMEMNRRKKIDQFF